MQEKSNSSAQSTTVNTPDELDSINAVDYSDLLPLELIKSETVPPSPNRSESTIDWLPDFAGLSWIAYGASSLLVISHFPSPLSEKETLIGPIFRQVLELSGDESAIVKAVAWSPSTPSKGELAVALENCVCLYLENSETMQGSFCWSQNAVLVQSSTMESIKWTGSGDGIIAAGIEVVLWKKKGKTWEIAWKFRPEQPQTLVSATWSIEGPAATAAYSSRMQNEGSSSLFREAGRCVFVYHSDGKSGYVKAELHHPQPVSMIQWRPSTAAQSRKDTKQSQRDVLLTCCFDGTVRLWSEIDSGRAKKFGKDTNDQKTMRRSFHVTAVIEINQSLHGTLGIDTYVTWAIENVDMINTSEGGKQHLSTEGLQQDVAGSCEWLIGFGPGTLVTFWAIHCLDDISPLRFPRVTLWNRQEILGPEVGHIHRTDNSNSKHQSLLNKFIILRSRHFGPPTKCSLIQLLPCNSMRWSQLYTPASSNTKDGSCNESRKENLSCSAAGFLSLDGHTGNILQVAVHPSSCEVEVAVSLDSKGLLLFWSLSTISRCISGIPSLVHPTWKLLGKNVTQDLSCFKYSSLRWAPSVLNGNRILLMGHVGGIDCFIIKISEIEEAKMLCHKLCTIPFTSHSHGDGPTNIFAIPLPSNCRKPFISNNFMLLGVWTKKFQALSWKVSLHFEDLSEGSCGCSFDTGSIANCSVWSFENTFSGLRYRVVADPCSSKLPDLHNPDQVTSVAVVCPGNLTPSVQQKWVSSNGLCSNPSAYHMATGCSDGSVKLWRSNHAKSSTPHSELAHLPWELVGMFSTHQGPVNAISLSGCGRKIATISTAGYSDTVSRLSTLHIWESVNLIGAGTFLVEDKLLLDGDVIALNWLATGNGMLLLGVCMENELRLFAQRRCGVQTQVKPGKSMEMHFWFCIAFGRTSPAVRDFLWGPRATPVLVHDRYFCHFSQWSFYTDKKHQAKCYREFSKDNPLPCMDGTDKDMLSAIFTDCDICNIKELSMGDKCEGCKCMLPAKMNMKNDNLLCNLFLTRAQWQYDMGTMIGLWSMVEVAEKLCGSLPVYHPEALLLNIYSGNWKRAYVAVQHLVGYLTSANASEKGYTSAKSSHIIPQIHLSNYFQVLLSTSSGNNGLQWGGDAASVTSASQSERSLIQFSGYNSEAMFTPTSGNSDISGFIETLEKFHDLAAITNVENMKILAVIDLLGEISDSCSPYGSLDEPGRRFWVAVRFQKLYFLRRFGRLAATEELVVNSGLIGWAFHSDCQENLFGSVLSNEPSWQEMRNVGVGFWFTNATQLRTRMEKLARLQYLKKRDPKDCALLYIALNRLQVLAGLFKISKDEKDKPLVGFLSRNFQEEKNKAAALKNAYVLMGRHQLELAVAFFLLGGDTSSAITVCAKNLGDEQLALIICRLVEGFGGLLERHLITKFLLPAATEKGDYWLTSLLEWALGNYYQSFLNLLGLQVGLVINKSALSSNHASFLDPDIGRYCLTLATKNSMRNAVGESGAAILARWATLMTATASNRRGLSLEALECLSSSLSVIEGKDQGRVSDIEDHGILQGILKPSPHDGFNWLSGDVAFQLESHAKLDLAMQYISKVIMEHPSWPDTNFTSCGALICPMEYETHQYELLLEKFKHKLNAGLANFEQKYSLSSVYLINMIFVYLYSNGLLFLGYHILDGYTSPEHSRDQNHTVDSFLLNPILPKLLLKTTEEISYLFARYIVACSITCSTLKPNSTESTVLGKNRTCQLDAWDLYVQGLIQSMRSLRAALKFFSGIPAEDLPMKAFISLDLFEYHIYIVSAWLQRNMKSFIMMIHPILITYTDGHTPLEIDVANLKKLLYQSAELMAHGSLCDDVGGDLSVAKQWKHEHGVDIISSIPEDERWKLIGACLWRHLSNFTNDQLKSLYEDVEDDYSSSIPLDTLSSLASSSASVSDGDSTLKQIKLVSVILVKLLKNTLAHISSYHAKQLALFLQQKVEKGLPVPSLVWLAECSRSQPRAPHKYLNHEINSLQMINNENGAPFSEILLEISADPKIVNEVLAEEKKSCSQFISQEPLKGWTDTHKNIMGGGGTGDAYDQEGRLSSVSASSGTGSPARGQSSENHSFLGSRRKESTLAKEVTCFQNPKEVYHKNGELLEAMCINSIDQQQAAVASNRKGIIFFKWKDGAPFRDQLDYIWSAADWPLNGWAGSESTPIPTFVSPGVGLGSKKGAHLGLGGATIGVGSLARPGRDLTGGGAFGIPGYAGIGASGLGWGIQEDFEEFVDPPATVENVRTRALSSHPSRPLFLVGSSNTHVYLWEFGKDRATATYGVLPAANVPPPYALASISALQFDHCGHRFATAALDGTVCTWQLEVGGRSNVRPAESSLCFNSHTSDVSYVAASGSIIAAAGYSSNGVNVVVWDTLAPPTTSQASLTCHEGGARSLSVFDNDIGSGSISPLIVTGGKGGDVGLHDFRFIATGRTKRHRHSNTSEQNINFSSTHDTRSGISSKFGEQNLNGMLWYIPKAHLGSITRIATIPNTSLFLTGSKDGDIKLWDAKRAELVFHWPKLHERHTFLQPSSRGFGGVVRAAVTDIQVLSHGFLSCGGDGSVKLVQVKDFQQRT